ncbi:MAG: 23S rRNA (guanosine(2251)-2'-O)-methyltransferase RlmB [Bacteroidota bacterium]
MKLATSQYPQPNLILGPRAIMEAIQAGKGIDKVWIDRAAKGALRRELLSLVQEQQLAYSQVPVAKLNRLATQKHQGAVARLAPIGWASLSHVIQASYEQGRAPLVLILDSVTDVRNLGAIVRTAVCAGVDAIVVPNQGSAAIGGDAMKTSAGALAHVPICRAGSLLATIQYLQASGLQVMAFHDKAATSLYQTELHMPLAIVVGNEEKGIRAELLQSADKQVSIPMVGAMGSLNVSVAAAVVLYESFRQRQD